MIAIQTCLLRFNVKKAEELIGDKLSPTILGGRIICFNTLCLQNQFIAYQIINNFLFVWIMSFSFFIIMLVKQQKQQQQQQHKHLKRKLAGAQGMTLNFIWWEISSSWEYSFIAITLSSTLTLMGVPVRVGSIWSV